MSILDIFVSKFEFILGFTWYYVVVFLALVTIVVLVVLWSTTQRWRGLINSRSRSCRP